MPDLIGLMEKESSSHESPSKGDETLSQIEDSLSGCREVGKNGRIKYSSNEVVLPHFNPLKNTVRLRGGGGQGERTISAQVMIPQVDGEVGNSSEDEVNIKKIFAVNSECEEINQSLSFFRGFSSIWKLFENHKLCPESSTNPCFFCHMRSTFLRLVSSRGRGPKSLKVVEVISQLDQYQTHLGWNWKENIGNTPAFIENSLKLLNRCENQIQDVFGLPDLMCVKCKKTKELPKELAYLFKTSNITNKTISLKNCIDDMISKEDTNQCCQENWKFSSCREKCIILHFSQPVSIHVDEVLYGETMKVLSVVNQKPDNLKSDFTSSFDFQGQIFHRPSLLI